MKFLPNVTLTYHLNLIFRHVNASHHAARYTTDYLKCVVAWNGTITEWSIGHAAPMILNPRKEIWKILSEVEFQLHWLHYTHKDDLWVAFLTAAKDIFDGPKSVSHISNNGGWVKYLFVAWKDTKLLISAFLFYLYHINMKYPFIFNFYHQLVHRISICVPYKL